MLDQKKYNCFDDNVFDGVSYYRLKQTDFNGHYEYFPAKSINSSSEGSSFKIINVSPNPFSSQFNLVIESENEGVADFVLTNMSGKNVYSDQIQLNKGKTEYHYNIGTNLSSGTYIIHLVQDNTKATFKVIKN